MKEIEGKDGLINRSQMLEIAREYKIFITKSTIHRWANEPDFPRVVGKGGKYLLYSQSDFAEFLNQRIMKIQDEH